MNQLLAIDLSCVRAIVNLRDVAVSLLSGEKM